MCARVMRLTESEEKEREDRLDDDHVNLDAVAPELPATRGQAHGYFFALWHFVREPYVSTVHASWVVTV
eukprot:5073047-Prymnesium_polylepis.1